MKQAEDLASLPFVDDLTVKGSFAEFCTGLNFVHGNLHMTFASVTADHTSHHLSYAVLIRAAHFGAVAEGWNSRSPSILYCPIAACPSGDSSHCAKRRANACFGTGCFSGFSRITS